MELRKLGRPYPSVFMNVSSSLFFHSMDLILHIITRLVHVFEIAIPPLLRRRYFYPADNTTAGESDVMWDLAALEAPANR